MSSGHEAVPKQFADFFTHAINLGLLVAELNQKVDEWELGADFAQFVSQALIVIANNSRPQSMTQADISFAEIDKLFPMLTKEINWPVQSRELAKEILARRELLRKSVRRPDARGDDPEIFRASASAVAKKEPPKKHW